MQGTWEHWEAGKTAGILGNTFLCDLLWGTHGSGLFLVSPKDSIFIIERHRLAPGFVYLTGNMRMMQEAAGFAYHLARSALGC